MENAYLLYVKKFFVSLPWQSEKIEKKGIPVEDDSGFANRELLSHATRSRRCQNKSVLYVAIKCVYEENDNLFVSISNVVLATINVCILFHRVS